MLNHCHLIFKLGFSFRSYMAEILHIQSQSMDDEYGGRNDDQMGSGIHV